jgi:DivIVA domain-containing protein
MALDRQSIEKRDFPIGRRGYEAEAVDAHLARVAEDVEQLRAELTRTSASPAPVAQAASAQVQAIVEVAEASAAAIERSARDDAEVTRQQAIERSREHVEKVRAATAAMLQRLDTMESELTSLVESLRTGANRVAADLSLLEQGMAELYGAAGREQPAAPVATASTPAPPVMPEPVVQADEVVVARVAVPAESAGGTDVEGARLVALNMALNGTSREETERYLSAHFDLDDRDTLLDEVYATVEG